MRDRKRENERWREEKQSRRVDTWCPLIMHRYRDRDELFRRVWNWMDRSVGTIRNMCMSHAETTVQCFEREGGFDAIATPRASNPLCISFPPLCVQHFAQNPFPLAHHFHLITRLVSRGIIQGVMWKSRRCLFYAERRKYRVIIPCELMQGVRHYLRFLVVNCWINPHF